MDCLPQPPRIPFPYIILPKYFQTTALSFQILIFLHTQVNPTPKQFGFYGIMNLKEIIRSSWALMPTFIPWCRIELREFAVIVNFLFGASISIVVYFHNCSLVATTVAVIGRRKDCDNGSIVLPLVTLHDKLMRTSQEKETINVGELLRNILAERVSSTPWRNTPAAPVIRIGPHKVTHRSFMRHFLDSVQVPCMIKCVNGW
mmetsp:Transcript_3390/g.4053  ORF Transcript_3390/g.4053 Transcript_3390/m.4053 type:complete len:202 (-) Transcript_3390:470-1075(-)